jgi:DNA-binding response OmpR family regulator
MTGIGFIRRWLGGQSLPDGTSEGSLLQAPAGTRMLVVDDSPTIRAVLGKLLDQDGYAVQKTVDGETAIELAKTELPELIFLDIVLPGINGFAVLRALRHDAATRHIPIVMISGNQQATEQFYVQRFGADDFIKKPFGQRELRQSIQQLVRAGRLPARMPSAAPASGPAEAAAIPYKDVGDTLPGMAA